MPFSSRDVTSAVARRLRYYIDTERREDAFDLSVTQRASLEAPVYRNHPPLARGKMQLHSLKHYFAEPVVRGVHPGDWTKCGQPEDGQRESKIRQQIWADMTKMNMKDGTFRKVRSSSSLARRRDLWPRRAPPPYISQGEVARLVSSAAKMIVDTEVLVLASGDPSAPQCHPRKMEVSLPPLRDASQGSGSMPPQYNENGALPATQEAVRHRGSTRRSPNPSMCASVSPRGRSFQRVEDPVGRLLKRNKKSVSPPRPEPSNNRNLSTGGSSWTSPGTLGLGTAEPNRSSDSGAKTPQKGDAAGGQKDGSVGKDAEVSRKKQRTDHSSPVAGRPAKESLLGDDEVVMETEAEIHPQEQNASYKGDEDGQLEKPKEQMVPGEATETLKSQDEANGLKEGWRELTSSVGADTLARAHHTSESQGGDPGAGRHQDSGKDISGQSHHFGGQTSEENEEDFRPEEQECRPTAGEHKNGEESHQAELEEENQQEQQTICYSDSTTKVTSSPPQYTLQRIAYSSSEDEDETPTPPHAPPEGFLQSCLAMSEDTKFSSDSPEPESHLQQGGPLDTENDRVKDRRKSKRSESRATTGRHEDADSLRILLDDTGSVVSDISDWGEQETPGL